MTADWKTVEIPPRLRGRPRNKAGYVVPWFVAEIDGDWDFRIVREEAIVEAVREERCFLCGQRMGKWGVFAIGPMCSINRISAEPPGHLDCVQYALRVCPFMLNPNMIRRGREGIEAKVAAGELKAPDGTMIPRNPGVTVEWVSTGWWPQAVPAEFGGGVLFNVGEPSRVTWWAKGRHATWDEALEGIASGFPTLIDAAKTEGPQGLIQLGAMTHNALKLLPDGGSFDDALTKMTTILGEAVAS